MSGNSDASFNDPNSTGGAGSIREAGGAFSRMGMVREEQYFYNQQKEEMKRLNDTLKNVKEVIYSKNDGKEHSDETNT
uniref:ATPase inhibitor, mitochondrial n=1 Tax=Onchocerca volvulus TaxID=6282 RepID=A0A8R1XP06_ONCVO